MLISFFLFLFVIEGAYFCVYIYAAEREGRKEGRRERWMWCGGAINVEEVIMDIAIVEILFRFSYR